MAKYRDVIHQKRKKQNPDRALILCEGQCEVWYFTKVLSTKLVKVEKVGDSKSNAEFLVKQAVKKQNEEDVTYSKIFCVFDHDSESNTRLEPVNKVIVDNKFERVFSNPCFEVFFLFSKSGTNSIYRGYKEIQAKLNKVLEVDYNKKENDIKNIFTKTEFEKICDNAQKAYEKLNINNYNWLNLNEGFSEIFKLREYVNASCHD